MAKNDKKLKKQKKTHRKKGNTGRIFLLFLIAFVVLLFIGYRFSRTNVNQRNINLEKSQGRVAENKISRSALRNMSPEEQIYHFAETNGILRSLVRISKNRDNFDVVLHINRAEADLFHINFQLTRYLTSIGWRQVSGTQPANQSVHILTFTPPGDKTEYRFRLSFATAGAYPPSNISVAIVVKGFGELRNRDLERWLQKNKKLCYAVLPINRHSRANIQNMVNRGFETLIEIPMENTAGFQHPNAIMARFRNNEVTSKLDQFFRLLPNASGTISHGGSLVTTDERIMPVILNYIRRRNLYFIDDMSTNTSIAYTEAQKMMLVSYRKTITFNPTDFQNDDSNTRLTAAMRTLLNQKRANNDRSPIIITINRPDDHTYYFVEKLQIVIKNLNLDLQRVSEF
jgi:hypothetical protein